ncbi:MAG TPA: (Fe-S)-binding protein [Thermoanaerobaculia bacterium]|nr:(Fe-S)-binding protein [Thermoanaerobaculia bacterium]HUM30537.1 (Fe-S)-binding protein [Thermoanaerobaculia bacterium]HXK68729.1 (Fe-S)-binding protein [Thermoanaerobaculia bacterium]
MKRIALFIPCLIDLSMPDTGLHMADLLEHAGFTVVCPENQTCCGQPAFNTGFREEGLPYARHFLEIFEREAVDAIVSPSGSCTAMVKIHYGELSLTQCERESWNRLRDHIYEFCEFFSEFAPLEQFTFQGAEKILFHDPCHLLRELGVEEAPRRLLARVAGIDLFPSPPARCCGFGGTFSVKYPDLSVKMTDTRLDELLQNRDVDTLLTADPSCLIQIRGRARERGLSIQCEHIIDFLHRCWVHE